VLSLLNDIVFVETSQALGKLLGVIKSESSIARRKAALCKVVGTECPGGR
jgi:ribosomal protein L7Ae-like RNA K-turn-binding protein